MNSKQLFIVVFTLLLIGLSQIEGAKDTVRGVWIGIQKQLVSFARQTYGVISSYFNATQKVRVLEAENLKLKTKINQLEAVVTGLAQLPYFHRISKPYLRFTQVISYANLPYFSRVFVDYRGKIVRPKGLVYNNMTAGIVTKSFKSGALALLNSDPQCSYAVYIGKGYVPGVFKGGEMKIKYIPLFKKVKVGDEVITSGIDGVFYRGAKVGKIVKVEKRKLYQEAVVKPYLDGTNLNYFYVVEKVPPEERKPYRPPVEVNSTDQNRTETNLTEANLSKVGEENGSTPKKIEKRR
jgi:rod shape-determining protein MreC